MKTYDLRVLNGLAKESNFSRNTLEKILRLIDFLNLFNTHQELKGKYVLKGGTAINLCLFDLLRLSVDIDLNFNGDYNREEMEEIRLLHKKVITEQASLMGYALSAKSRFTFTLDSYLLQYKNVVGGNDYIKLELNYSNRIQLLTPVIYKTSSLLVPSVAVLALDKIELYATKIAALVGRTTARDIFDVYQMIEQKVIKQEEMESLRKISIFFLVLANEFESIELLLNRFRTSMQNINYFNYKRNLVPMLKVGITIDVSSYENVVLSFINKLFTLNYTEMEFINSYNSGAFKPELLFNEEMANKAIKHPMIIWKFNNFEKNKKE